MTTCSQCQTREATKSSVINATYYPHLCQICYEGLLGGHNPSSGYAEYQRGRDAEEHGADILQPSRDGKPNADFIRTYPDTAKKIFTTEEIRDSYRK